MQIAVDKAPQESFLYLKDEENIKLCKTFNELLKEIYDYGIS